MHRSRRCRQTTHGPARWGPLVESIASKGEELVSLARRGAPYGNSGSLWADVWRAPPVPGGGTGWACQPRSALAPPCGWTLGGICCARSLSTMAGVTSDVSLQTRFLTWFRAIPICTAAILCICVGLYAAQLVFGWDDFAAYCMQPASVLFRYQVYRAYTAIFLHGGVLHVAFNMMTFVPLGTSLERMVGSFRCCYLLVVLFATIAAVIHVLAALVAAYNPVYQVRRELYACAIGFSGIVFALIVVETHMSRATTRSIFGFFAVPAQLYPWALLVLFQVIMYAPPGVYDGRAPPLEPQAVHRVIRLGMGAVSAGLMFPCWDICPASLLASSTQGNGWSTSFRALPQLLR
eukprot:scaffold51_cov401-Prasinococcus_capsulatus_cf.AAC.35